MRQIPLENRNIQIKSDTEAEAAENKKSKIEKKITVGITEQVSDL